MNSKATNIKKMPFNLENNQIKVGKNNAVHIIKPLH